MKLDRNQSSDGLGKYALINLRKLYQPGLPMEATAAVQLLSDLGILEWGRVGEQDEFFLMKLKDIFSPGGLRGYADMAEAVDPEWAAEVREMLPRAGTNSPFCKRPD